MGGRPPLEGLAGPPAWSSGVAWPPLGPSGVASNPFDFFFFFFYTHHDSYRGWPASGPPLVHACGWPATHLIFGRPPTKGPGVAAPPLEGLAGPPAWPFSNGIPIPQTKRTLRKSIAYRKLLTFFLCIHFFQFIHLGDHSTLKFEKDIKGKYCLSQVADLFPPHTLLSIYPPR
jgi:hypothetical protein